MSKLFWKCRTDFENEGIVGTDFENFEVILWMSKYILKMVFMILKISDWFWKREELLELILKKSWYYKIKCV